MIQHEKILAYEIHHKLSLLKFKKKLHCNYLHIPNEFPIGKNFRNVKWVDSLKKQGMLLGAPDYLFFGENLHSAFPSSTFFFVELKSLKGKLSKPQQEFRNNCLSLNIDYFVIRDWETLNEILWKKRWIHL